jgi:hypothetical protein
MCGLLRHFQNHYTSKNLDFHVIQIKNISDEINVVVTTDSEDSDQ